MADVFCPKCGYNLYGIPEVRCPECGFHYDHAAIRSLARDESAETFTAAKLVLVRSLLALGCATTPLARAAHLSAATSFVTAFVLIAAALCLWRCLPAPTPFRAGETVPVAFLWLIASATIAILLSMVPLLGSLAGSAVLVDGWQIFARRLRERTDALLSLASAERTRVSRISRWAGAALAVSSVLVAASWVC